MTKLLAVAGIALAAALSFAGPAFAATTTMTQDYGTTTNVRPISGGEGSRTSATYVTVDDSTQPRFYDAFDLSGIVGTITSFTLTLDITGGKDNAGSLFGVPKESWQVYGSTDSSTDSNTRATLGTLNNSNQWVFTVTSLAIGALADVFETAVSDGWFRFWFGDSGYKANSFQLNSATLNVEYTPTLSAVPVPAGLPLLAGGLALLGVIGARRKARHTAA